MPIMFYPHVDDANNGTLKERIDVLSEAAARYKAAMTEGSSKAPIGGQVALATLPREITHAFNWEEIAVVLREIREMPEVSKDDKIKKADYLMKLAEVYEVLRDTKMPKLEAVRLALTNESNQLTGNKAAAPGSAAPGP